MQERRVSPGSCPHGLSGPRAAVQDEPHVNDAVRNKAIAARAAQSSRDLPSIVAEVEHKGAIAVGRPYVDSTEALVAKATCENGTPTLLKVHVDRPGRYARGEITLLRLTDGEGCIRVL